MNKAIKLILLLGILVLVLGYYAAHKVRTGPETRSETLALAGLNEPVEILYDSMGVPHIFAASIEDLFLAQGYVHAKHRLWQMEMFRRVQQGRLSEIFGEATVDTDRFLRTIGMEEAARAGTPFRNTPIYQQTARYVAGVNAAIEGWRGLLPPEFLVLRFKPEPWEPVLSQGIEKIMAWDLSDYQTGLNLAAARETLGDEALVPLMPRYPEWGVTIVEGWPEGLRAATSAGPVGVAVEGNRAEPTPFPPSVSLDLLTQASISEDIARVLELGSMVRASNSWVVGGKRSRSGKPLLANDMHLALNAPNIWFLMGLHAPGYEVVGMSIPGAPGVAAGHSKAVAWGFTNAMADDSDFFIERVNPENPDEYLAPGGTGSFKTREEIIRVRGRNPVVMEVRSTHHGPIVTPVEDRAGDQLLAFQWVAHSAAGTFQALLDMGRAQNADEFLRAMRQFDNPHQNVIFADTAGAWGYWLGGHVPVRASGKPPHLPVPGWTGEHDWGGWVPFEEKPHTLAPDRGYIATANNAQGRDEAAQLVSDGGWFGPYRAQRISELIEAQDLHDAESLLAIQMNTGSAFVDRHLHYAVEAFQAAGLDDLAGRLERWDRLADLESTEATLFHTWWTFLHNEFGDHYYGGERGYFPDRILEEALDGESAAGPRTPTNSFGP
jgi:penicillin amidase